LLGWFLFGMFCPGMDAGETSGIVLPGDCGTVWHWANPLPQGNQIRAITWGGERYVAIGYYGTVLTSIDGLLWQSRPSGTHNALNDIMHHGSRFIAVGNYGAILTSPDGKTWTHLLSGTTHALYGIGYGKSLFVVVGNHGTVLTSSDGISWTARQSGTSSRLFGIEYNQSQFVCVGSNGMVLTSTDGINWSCRTVPENRLDLYSIASCDDRFVAVGYAGTVMMSLDGVSWIIQKSGTVQDLYAVVYEDNQFVAVGFGGTILTSADGIRWTRQDSWSDEGLSGVVFADSRFVAVGYYGTILTSPEGMTWTNQTSGPVQELFGMAFSGSQFVTVGRAGAVMTSPDGLNWTFRPMEGNQWLRDVTYADHQFVAVGDGGCIMASPDGITWTSRVSGTDKNMYSLAHDGSQFVCVGEWGRVITSPNGISWTIRSSGTTRDLYGVVYGDSKLVSVGRNGKIVTSFDGVQWISRSSGTDRHLYDIEYGGSLFVVVGEEGTLLTSPDGVEWTLGNMGSENHFSSVVYQGAGFVAAGNNGRIAVSSDSLNWRIQKSGTVNDLFGIGYGGQRLVAVGDGGTILVSVGSIGNINAGAVYETDNIIGVLRYVPSGRFKQGSPLGEPCRRSHEEAQFTHLLSRDLAVMETEVTRTMWAEVQHPFHFLPDDPSDMAIGSNWHDPIQNCTWFEAVLFANLLSAAHGLTRCYTNDAGKTVFIDAANFRSSNVYCDFDADGYRLPTEGEWEYFCRAGTKSAFWVQEPNYSRINCSFSGAGPFPSLASAAVFGGWDGQRAVFPTGSRKANPWGLVDTCGNVAEWCWDGFALEYPKGNVTDYSGWKDGEQRVYRGGHWASGAVDCRSASRRHAHPDTRSNGLGFRLVRTIPASRPHLTINRISTREYPELEVILTVRDQDHHLVSGLTQADFLVTQDHNPLSFDVRPVMSSGAHLSIALCMDVSGSLSPTDLSAECAFAAALIQSLDEDDMTAIFTAGTVVNMIQDFTRDKTRLENALTGLAPGGYTSINDMVYLAMENTNLRNGLKAVIALTDGNDSHSHHSGKDLIRLARQMGIPVYTIGCGNFNKTVLQNLADGSGGRFFSSLNADAIGAIFSQLRGCDHGRYIITCTTGTPDDVSHTLLVAARINGHSAQDRVVYSGFGPGGEKALLGMDTNHTSPPGTQVLIPVWIQTTSSGMVDSLNIESFQFTLNFDPTLLSLVSVWNSDTLSSGWNVSPEIRSGCVTIHADSSRSLTGKGTLIKLEFTVSPTVSPGDSTAVTFSDFQTNQGHSSGITRAGHFSVRDFCIKGDISGDGEISVFDALQIENQLLGIAVSFESLELCSADTTCDGTISAYDAAQIRKCEEGVIADFQVERPEPGEDVPILRVASDAIYQEGPFTWRMPVILEGNAPVEACELVLRKTRGLSIEVKPSIQTDSWEIRSHPRGESLKVVMVGIAPVRDGIFAWVEITIDPYDTDAVSQFAATAEFLSLFLAYRVNEFPVVEITNQGMD